ncbi:MAG: type II toxin-antitoxin system VapC family toxin [Candidatus Omnitrophica bacterium]|nr:type II toxin-antitoxin system VapC family toxin [Candidatus Omnitrophota bacterium]
MVKILDASALVAYLWKQSGYEKVQDFLTKATDGQKRLLMTTVNLGEVYYLLLRDHGPEDADKILKVIETLPIDFTEVDMKLAKQAALYKAAKKLPYADCFAAALAKLQKGEVITGDKEFKAVENDVKIAWIT